MLQSQTINLREAIQLRDTILRHCHIDFTPYQEDASNEIIKAALQRTAGEYFLWWARQSGKTECLTISDLTLAIYSIRYLREPFDIGIFTPARSQAVITSKDRLQRRFKSISKWLADQLGIESNLGGEARTTSQFYFYCPDTDVECKILALSADRMANIKSPSLDIIQLEQSEDMDPDKMENDIFPMAAARAGIRIHAITSTTNFKNYYAFDRLTKNPRGSIKLPRGYLVTDKEVLKYPEVILGYPKFIEEMKRDLGEDSDSFRTQYRLEWILPRNKLVDWNTLENLKEKTPYISDTNNPRFGAVDVAKEDDSTVATSLERSGLTNHILRWQEHEGTDYEVQVDELAEFFKVPRPQLVLVDSRGPGDPVEDLLRNRLQHYGIRVEGWLPSPLNNDITGKQLEQELKAIPPRLFYPAEETREQRRFIQQLLDCEKVYKTDKLKLEHPRRRSAKDDYVKSLEMALHASLKGSVKGVGQAAAMPEERIVEELESIDWEKVEW